MKFRVGNKVKVKERLISKLQTPNLVKNLRNIGTVVDGDIRGHQKVMFSKDIWYWISDTDLELIKNQQLLFNFMG